MIIFHTQVKVSQRKRVNSYRYIHSSQTYAWCRRVGHEDVVAQTDAAQEVTLCRHNLVDDAHARLAVPRNHFLSMSLLFLSFAPLRLDQLPATVKYNKQ